jgi:hypothetical protein
LFHIFLADPLHTSCPLPPFERRRVRYVYQMHLDRPADATDTELLEVVFQMLNVNHRRDYAERSLSVGDVVTIAESRSYVCDWTGWLLLNSTIKCGDILARPQPTDGNSGTPRLLASRVEPCLTFMVPSED